MNQIETSQYGQRLTFADGDCIYEQGDPAEACFLVERGSVATFFYDEDLDISVLVNRYQAGESFGSADTLSHSERAVSAIAQENSVLRAVTRQQMDDLLIHDPLAYQQFVKSTLHSMAARYKQFYQQVSQQRVQEQTSPKVEFVVSKAQRAQKAFHLWLQTGDLQALIQAIASAVNEQACEFARAIVEETGMGVYADKVQKIRLGTLEVAAMLHEEQGEMQLSADGMEQLSMPMGVIFGMIPVTNPVETIVFKSLISLKAGNAIIISSHRKASSVGQRAVDVIREVLHRFGAPADMVQTTGVAAMRKFTHAFMAHPGISLILATGGPGMVKSAYQSGTPAIGVGKGNAPVWIAADAKVGLAATQIVHSKSFDNGIVCGSENNLVVDQQVWPEFKLACEQQGAVLLTAQQREAVYQCLYHQGQLRGEWVGQSALKVLQSAGIYDYPSARLLLVNCDDLPQDHPFMHEKLLPMLSVTLVDSNESAIERAAQILALEGEGHTAIIYSQDEANIQAFSQRMVVSRVLVNSSGTLGCIGACNGLSLSWTLGCGTAGGGSVSENVTYRHLQNKKTIARNLAI